MKIEQNNLGMAEDVQVIVNAAQAVAEPKRIKVAAYCRVSTEHNQESSIDLQMQTYRKIIKEYPDWELAEIYADYGRSGTGVKKRKEFLRMIEDAKAGKIDMILAKSTSRIARNTEDMLHYTRELRNIGVGIYFEKEGINTLDIASEMLLTVYAAFSQEESHETSELQKISIRNRFKMGVPMKSRIYGYRISKDGEWTVEPEEAAVIKQIFEYAAQGMSTIQISQILSDTMDTTTGCWDKSRISFILQNEKYVGDYLMQKTVTTNFLTRKRQVNRDAAVPQYFKENHHEAIVDRETFREAQMMMAMKNGNRGCLQYPYYGYLFCPHCGAPMVACSLNGSGKQRAWICSGKGDEVLQSSRSNCPTYALYESVLNKALVKAMKDYLGKQKDEALKAMRESLTSDTVERFHLKTLIDRIAFPDWEHMAITWKDGKITKVPFIFEAPRQHPYPTDEVLREYWPDWFRENVYHKFRRGISNREDYIRRLIIFMPEEGDPIPIPRVIKEKPNDYKQQDHS